MKQKKMIVSLLLGMAAVGASAQTAVEGNYLLDNWSIGINAGGTTPFAHSAFLKNMRPVVGLDVKKQLTPIFGLSFEAMGSINTTPSKTVIDNTNASLLGVVNLHNLFGTYPGKPRTFEIEAVAGIGWLHYYVNQGVGYDVDSPSTKVGLNFNFNLGESKAWTLAVKPAMIFDMNGVAGRYGFHANYAAWELTAGLRYHFKCSNGERYFTKVKSYNPKEIDNLNSKVNQLRQEVAKNANALAMANQKNNELERALEDCKKQEPKVITNTLETSNKSLESFITFGQGKSTVNASQLPNIERIATYMKKRAGVIVIIKGYASPEGSAEINARLAQQRADAVKTILINKYKIAADRITAEGQGVGDIFEEPDWNRVSICTLNEDQTKK